MVSCCGKVWQLLKNLNIKLPSNATARCVPKRTAGRRQVLRHPTIYRRNNNQLVERTQRPPTSEWRHKTRSMCTRNGVRHKKMKRQYVLDVDGPQKTLHSMKTPHTKGHITLGFHYMNDPEWVSPQTQKRTMVVAGGSGEKGMKGDEME